MLGVVIAIRDVAATRECGKVLAGFDRVGLVGVVVQSAPTDLMYVRKGKQGVFWGRD